MVLLDIRSHISGRSYCARQRRMEVRLYTLGCCVRLANLAVQVLPGAHLPIRIISSCHLLFVPETKNRTLEEIGEIFGDKHIAAHWYGISEEEKQKIAQDAMKLTVDGRIPSDTDLKPPVNDVETQENDIEKKENESDTKENA